MISRYFFLLVFFTCFISCEKRDTVKSVEQEDLIQDQSKVSLEELSSAIEEVDSVQPVDQKVEGEETMSVEITSFEISKNECKKCSIDKVSAIDKNIASLSYQLIYDFLCTFHDSCSDNVEYSEYSSDILYKVLVMYPEAIVEIISNHKELDSEIIYNEISSPLLDYNYDLIIEKVSNIKGYDEVKSKVIKSVQKAIQG